MTAPVTYDPHFIGTPERDSFFDHLWHDLPWENREGAPRRECWFNPYDMPYTYGSGEFARTYQANSAESDAGRLIYKIMDYLSWLHDACFDCCFVNGYAHGRQHLGWHADDSPEMAHEHPIAVVSLGSEREIWFREQGWDSDPRATRGSPQFELHKQLLGHGSLLLMHAGMQREWQHRIPKSPLGDQCPPRLSLTFRKLVR